MTGINSSAISIFQEFGKVFLASGITSRGKRGSGSNNTTNTNIRPPSLPAIDVFTPKQTTTENNHASTSLLPVPSSSSILPLLQTASPLSTELKDELKKLLNLPKSSNITISSKSNSLVQGSISFTLNNGNKLQLPFSISLATSGPFRSYRYQIEGLPPVTNANRFVLVPKIFETIYNSKDNIPYLVLFNKEGNKCFLFMKNPRDGNITLQEVTKDGNKSLENLEIKTSHSDIFSENTQNQDEISFTDSDNTLHKVLTTTNEVLLNGVPMSGVKSLGTSNVTIAPPVQDSSSTTQDSTKNDNHISPQSSPSLDTEAKKGIRNLKAIPGAKLAIFNEVKVTEKQVQEIEEALEKLPQDIKDIFKGQLVIKVGLSGTFAKSPDRALGWVIELSNHELNLGNKWDAHTIYHELGHLLEFHFCKYLDPDTKDLVRDESDLWEETLGLKIDENEVNNTLSKFGLTKEQFNNIIKIYNHAKKGAWISENDYNTNQEYLIYAISLPEVYAELFSYYIEETQGLNQNWGEGHGYRGEIMERNFKPLYNHLKNTLWSNNQFLEKLKAFQTENLRKKRALAKNCKEMIKDKIFSGNNNTKTVAINKLEKVVLSSSLPQHDCLGTLVNVIYEEEIKPLVKEINNLIKNKDSKTELKIILKEILYNSDAPFDEAVKEIKQSLDKPIVRQDGASEASLERMKRHFPTLEKLAEIYSKVNSIKKWGWDSDFQSSNIYNHDSHKLSILIFLKLNEEFIDFKDESNPFKTDLGDLKNDDYLKFGMMSEVLLDNILKEDATSYNIRPNIPIPDPKTRSREDIERFFKEANEKYVPFYKAKLGIDPNLPVELVYDPNIKNQAESRDDGRIAFHSPEALTTLIVSHEFSHLRDNIYVTTLRLKSPEILKEELIEELTPLIGSARGRYVVNEGKIIPLALPRLTQPAVNKVKDLMKEILQSSTLSKDDDGFMVNRFNANLKLGEFWESLSSEEKAHFGNNNEAFKTLKDYFEYEFQRFETVSRWLTYKPNGMNITDSANKKYSNILTSSKVLINRLRILARRSINYTFERYDFQLDKDVPETLGVYFIRNEEIVARCFMLSDELSHVRYAKKFKKLLQSRPDKTKDFFGQPKEFQDKVKNTEGGEWFILLQGRLKFNTNLLKAKKILDRFLLTEDYSLIPKLKEAVENTEKFKEYCTYEKGEPPAGEVKVLDTLKEYLNKL